MSQQNSLGRGAMKAVTVSGPSRGQSNKQKPLISVRRLCLRWSRPGITGKGSIQSSLGMAEEPSWVARASGLGVSPRDGSDTLSADFRTGASLRGLLYLRRRRRHGVCKASGGRSWPQSHQVMTGHRHPHGSPSSPGGAAALGNSEAKAPRWKLTHGKEIFPDGI